MKKTAMMFVLMGGTLIGLAGCGGGGDDKGGTSATVESAKFSSLSGTYTGTFNGNGCGGGITGGRMTFDISSSDSTTTNIRITAGNQSLDAQGYSLTGNSFQFTVPSPVIEMAGVGSCGDGASMKGSCQYTSERLNCDYKINNLGKGTMSLDRG